MFIRTQNKMRILGIDPGYDRLGIAIIDKSNSKKDSVIYSFCLQTSNKDSIYDRLLNVGHTVNKVIEQYKPDCLAIETLFITKNQKTAMRVSEARGIVIYEASKSNIPIFEYSPMQIKMAITGDGSSDKSRIIKMIHLLVNIPNTNARDDEYDALAVALTHSANTRGVF